MDGCGGRIERRSGAIAARPDGERPEPRSRRIVEKYKPSEVRAWADAQVEEPSS